MLLTQSHNLINLLPPHNNMTDGQNQVAFYLFFLIVRQCVIQQCLRLSRTRTSLQNGSGPSLDWEMS